MRLLLITFILINSNCFGAKSPELRRKLRISGGQFDKIEHVPYQVQLTTNSHLFCGATIISKSWLLSAGHCAADKHPEKITAYIGSSFALKGKAHEIEKIIIHPKFNPRTLDNDISLLKLKQPIEFNDKTKPISLANIIPQPGSEISISGYGRQSDNDAHSPVVKVANVPIISITKCREQYLKNQDTITDSMFCAGDGTADACVGDSGGPAVANNLLVGIISAGQTCASSFYPGVYTRIDLFRDWIIRETNKKGNENLTKDEQNVLEKHEVLTNVVQAYDRPEVRPQIFFFKDYHYAPPFIYRTPVEPAFINQMPTQPVLIYQIQTQPAFVYGVPGQTW